MNRNTKLKLGAAIAALAYTAAPAWAESFNVSAGDLKSALDAYARQAGVTLAYSEDAIKGVRTKGAVGDLTPQAALTKILTGTGFAPRVHDGAVGIVRDPLKSSEAVELSPMQLAQAAPSRAAVETVTVTSSKLGGADVQSIPIAITALSQEQLTATQTAGGPDLVKQVPNLTFTKTNFTGYSIQIRGIGTQAISVTTDPAVAVAFNDQPFIRNHFFEQEFYDVAQVEVLRGPQGTLYGRNATAGVVNLTSAKPSDQFEAMASAEIGNYHQKRLEGMINLPIVDDRLDIRVAGEWTKRQGYSFNDLTDSRIDGRDLWSSRVSIGLKPFEGMQATLIWEHFSENDDRMRTAKQLCHRQAIPDLFGGDAAGSTGGTDVFLPANYGSQGCQMSSLYSPEAFEVPNGFSLPYYFGVGAAGLPITGKDPYVNRTQSQNLRVIETAFNPVYRVKNDIVEFNVDYAVTPELTFTSQTSFNHDFLWSMEDYNRFNTSPGVFAGFDGDSRFTPDGLNQCDANGQNCIPGGTFCDPQIGCSDRLVLEDLSDEHAWQLSQEFRLASNFGGPLNFSAGGNYLHYETDEDYYVFINSLTAYAAGTGTACGYHGGCTPWVVGQSDNSSCLFNGFILPVPSDFHGVGDCAYIDPNPVSSLDGNGHNYFRSQNPYVLNSYAAFGELYYNIFSDLKLTAGLRWTEDQKHFVEIPSELLVGGWGYPITGDLNQTWDQFTGRVAANWTPKLDFTDQTLIYGSYAHGYKAGGANPPGAVLLCYNCEAGFGVTNIPIHPLTFKPEFVDAFELGSKNTLLDGALTLNVSAFYYNYENYQISEIVDRTSINLNFDAHVKGAEVEATWEPLPGLRFNFAGGYEDARLAKGSKAVDLIDRTAGHSDWLVLKPFVTQASNCILPVYVIEYQLQYAGFSVNNDCGVAYADLHDPVTGQPYTSDLSNSTNRHGDPIIPGTYVGFDPLSVDPNAPANVNGGLGLPPNGGAGFDKDLSNNWLPNAPPLTVSAGAQYTIPLSSDWAGTLRADYYWQDYSWARIFNDHPYDRLRGYTNVNLTLILTSQNGWQVMLYDKNVFNTTAITGTFLNSDDTGLTTNVFLTDPKLIGLRVTKNW
ncbi:MAG TPA: TonB-dependent receptor [Rhizomicrobium sp.]|nr:TonB-dependent receptor [Rhizomicrobium sp.]